MNGYAHAMRYQRKLDEKSNPNNLTPPLQLINESNVLHADEESMNELKSNLRGLIYTSEGITNNKRKWVQQILNILEREYIQND